MSNNNKYLKNLKYVTPLIIGLSLVACDSNQDKKIAGFNRYHAPDYQLSHTHLLVNWKAGETRNNITAEPLKLNIPVAYLDGVLSDKGEIRTHRLEFDDGQLSTIRIGLRYSDGQPAIEEEYRTKLFDSEEVKEKRIINFRDLYMVDISAYPPLSHCFNRIIFWTYFKINR